ncbi:MAG: ChaN family lipoprotein [Planctomycetes bacterium]|nr:ChaN family lipoprotein [Planctomycetota bacterium]
MRMMKALGVAAVIAGALGCRALSPGPRGRINLADGNPSALPGRIAVPKTGQYSSRAELLSAIRGARIVFVGETHDNRFQHEIQLTLLKAMYEQDPRLAIGLEQFQRPWQGPIDDYVAGRIDEWTMLRRTEYATRWGFPWRFYAPLLRFAREHRLPVVALNASKETTRKVSREGLESLTTEERASIPYIDLTVAAHREWLREIYGQHQEEIDEAKFNRFYSAQCVWEDTMAWSVTNFLTAPGNEERRMIVFAGNGHIARGFGVPDRVRGRLDVPQVRVVTIDVPQDQDRDCTGLFGEDEGDFVWFTRPSDEGDESPRLGVKLASAMPSDHPTGGEVPAQHPTIAAAAGEVKVESVSESSPGARAGLMAGDVILSLDNYPLESADDLRLALGMKRLGERSKIQFRRDGKVRSAEVVLDPIPEPATHPTPETQPNSK